MKKGWAVGLDGQGTALVALASETRAECSRWRKPLERVKKAFLSNISKDF